MHLKYSNGSRQLVQRYKDLQGVEANSLTLAVCVEAQRGHATAIGSGTSCAERGQTTANGRLHRAAAQKCRTAIVSSIPSILPGV